MTCHRVLRSTTGRERGSASLEFIVAAVVLIVPVALFSAVMTQTFAVQAAAQNVARHGAHLFAIAASDARGRSALSSTAALTFADFGISSVTPAVTVRCSTTPCHQRGTVVTVTVTAQVPIIGLPLVERTTIPVTVSATERISQLWDIDAPR